MGAYDNICDTRLDCSGCGRDFFCYNFPAVCPYCGHDNTPEHKRVVH